MVDGNSCFLSVTSIWLVASQLVVVAKVHTLTLQILHIITGLNGGGAESVLFRLCKGDTDFRHRVISLMDDGKYGPILRAAGVPVQSLQMPRGRLTIKGLFRLARLLHEGKPDVVQTWMYHADLIGGMVARLLGHGAICWGIRHSNLEPDKNTRTTLWVARFCALISRIVPRVIISCSQQAADAHQAIGYDRRKLTVIPNGYDMAQFVPDSAARTRLREEWGVPATLPLLGMVARFNPQKDHGTLLHALAKLKRQGVGFRAVLVGEGMLTTESRLHDMLQDLGLGTDVMLIGPRLDIPAVMNALDVHVLSSAGEAFPNVLAEAMACGTPCVATDVGDASLILGDTGWVVPAKNPEALSNTLRQAISAWKDTSSWRARSAICRERIGAHFSLESMREAYQQMWLSAAARVERPPWEHSQE